MYYPSSENKGADQLRGYREADLRLCFRLCRLLVFPCGGSNALLSLEHRHEKACLHVLGEFQQHKTHADLLDPIVIRVLTFSTRVDLVKSEQDNMQAVLQLLCSHMLKQAFPQLDTFVDTFMI